MLSTESFRACAHKCQATWTQLYLIVATYRNLSKCSVVLHALITYSDTLFTLEIYMHNKVASRWNEYEITFSLRCDRMQDSFSRSFFNLASSSSSCLAAIASSSFATSSCWARHCCSCTHACKYTQVRDKKQVIAHQRLSWKKQWEGDNQLSPTHKVWPELREVSKLPLALCLAELKSEPCNKQERSVVLVHL